MTLLIGTARFTGPRTLDVSLSDGGVRQLSRVWRSIPLTYQAGHFNGRSYHPGVLNNLDQMLAAPARQKPIDIIHVDDSFDDKWLRFLSET